MGERRISAMDIVMGEYIREQAGTSGQWPAMPRSTQAGRLGEDSGTNEQSQPNVEINQQRPAIPQMVQQVLKRQRQRGEESR